MKAACAWTALLLGLEGVAAFAPLAPLRSFSSAPGRVSGGDPRTMGWGAGRRMGMVATEERSEFANIEKLRFLTPESAEAVRSTVGTPAYVYDMATLKKSAEAALAFPNAFGLTVRFAMKSCPNAAVLQLFHSMGLHFDCSSGWEVKRALAAGVPAEKLCLSTQELPSDIAELLSQGILVNACSLSQLETLGRECRGAEVGIRFNPGSGSGGTGQTNVGGPDSSFGVWHQWATRARELSQEGGITVRRVHTHIGSGSDPEVWQRVSAMSIDLVGEFPDVDTLNLGGGYKVGRMAGEKTTDLGVVGAPVKDAFEAFAKETGRSLKLEVEPGTFLVANAGALVSTIQDIVSTGPSGHDFLKLDAGMTDLLRPSLYGAQHPIVIVPAGGGGAAAAAAEGRDTHKYVVVGHCCESGDLLTPADGVPDQLEDRPLMRAEIGDLCVVEGSGAYVSGMSAKNYNSFPEAPEVLLSEMGNLHVIRRRQSLEQVFQNEVPAPQALFR